MYNYALITGTLLTSLMMLTPGVSQSQPLEYDGTGCSMPEGRPPCMVCAEHDRLITADWALEDSEFVTVDYESHEYYVTFTPTNPTREVRLMIFSGGGVPPTSYSPTANLLAREGFRVFILRNLPPGIGSPCAPLPGFAEIHDVVDLVIGENGGLTSRWAFAGHSQGGIIQSYYMQARGPNRPQVESLIYWGSYSPELEPTGPGTEPAMVEINEIEGLTGDNVIASHDGVTPVQLAIANAHLLPQSTQTHCIIGGNHSQFGWYNSEDPDDIALITQQDQQEQVSDRLLLHMLRVENRIPFESDNNQQEVTDCYAMNPNTDGK